MPSSDWNTSRGMERLTAVISAVSPPAPCWFPRCPPAGSRLLSWCRPESVFTGTSGSLFPPWTPLEPWDPGATRSPAPGPGPGPGAGPGPGGFADCSAVNRSASGLWWSGPWWSGPWWSRWWFSRVSMLKPPGWTSLLINLWRYWSGQRGEVGATVSFIVQPLLIHDASMHSSFHHPQCILYSSSSIHHPFLNSSAMHPAIHPPAIHHSSISPSQARRWH